MNYPKMRVDGVLIAVHTTVVEKALGRKLRGQEQVHHWDENKKNAAPENLVLCTNMAYHQLLHVRAAALNACGNPNFRRCHICKKYDTPENMHKISKTGGSYRHSKCQTQYNRNRVKS